GARSDGGARRLRRAERGAGDQCAAGRPRGTRGDRLADQRVRLHAQSRGSTGTQPDPAGEPLVVGGAVSSLPARQGRVRTTGALADRLPASVLGLGGNRGAGLPAAVRIHLRATGNPLLRLIVGW